MILTGISSEIGSKRREEAEERGRGGPGEEGEIHQAPVEGRVLYKGV